MENIKYKNERNEIMKTKKRMIVLLAAMFICSGCGGNQTSGSSKSTVSDRTVSIEESGTADLTDENEIVEEIKEYEVQEGENFSISFDGVQGE